MENYHELVQSFVEKEMDPLTEWHSDSFAYVIEFHKEAIVEILETVVHWQKGACDRDAYEKKVTALTEAIVYDSDLGTKQAKEKLDELKQELQHHHQVDYITDKQVVSEIRAMLGNIAQGNRFKIKKYIKANADKNTKNE